MAEPQRISPRWAGERCIVAASGPSLTPEVIRRVRLARWIDDWRVIVVNDVWKAIQHADILYAVDNRWWERHRDCAGFTGEKWAAHEQYAGSHETHGNDKRQLAEAYGINLVCGMDGDEFSLDPQFIRYGSNSGFQALNLAILFGCVRIVLVGFDMRHVNGKSHFFGDHPPDIGRTDDRGYRGFVRHFERAAKRLPPHISIVNATPESALTCFPMKALDDALADIRRSGDLLHRDRPESQAAAG